MENQAETKPTPTWAAVLAAASVFIAVPLWFVMLAIVTRGRVFRSSFGESEFAELFLEAGWVGYALLLAFGLATTFAAISVGLSVKRASVPSSVPLGGFALLAFLAWLGASSSTRMIVEAVGEANPLDRATILAASFGELLSLNVLSTSFAAAGFLAVGGALILGMIFSRRLALGAPAVVAVVCAFGAVLGGHYCADVSASLMAIAHANAEDRGALLVSSLDEAAPFRNLLLPVFAVAVLAALLPLVFVAKERSRALVNAAVLVAVVAVFGMFSREAYVGFFHALEAMAATQTDAASSLDGIDCRSDATVPLDIGAEGWTDVDAVADRAAERLKMWADLHSAAGDESVPLTAVVMGPGLTPRLLNPVLRRTAQLALQGSGAPNVPKDYEALRPFFGAVRRCLPLRALAKDAPCPDCAGEVAMRSWKDGTLPTSMDDVAKFPGVEFDWKGSPDELAKAARLAVSNGHVVVLRFEP